MKFFIVDLTYISHEMGDIWWAYSGSLRDIELELEMNPIMSTNLLLSDNPHVVCEVNKRLFSRDESYRIHITEKQVLILMLLLLHSQSRDP